MKLRKYLFVFLASVCAPAFAGGYTAWAAPTGLDVVRSEGIMVYGAFGNPGGCSIANQFFVVITHPQYKEIYASILMAIASGKQVMAYVGSCQSQGWYAVATTTFGYVTSSEVVNVKN